MIRSYFKYQLRTHNRFAQYLKECAAVERFEPDRIREYQEEQLRRVVKEAYEGVPYYRAVFDNLKLKPADIKTLGDLAKLPTIDKSTVRHNFRDFRNRGYLGPAFRGHTGGTTGSPGVFLRDPRSISFENASLWRQYTWAGKPFRSRRVTLRGAIIAPPNRKHPPFWRHDRVENELLLSSFHMTDENLGYYIEEILRFQPYDLYAYPSTAFTLANYCRRHGVDLRFQSVFTSSEVVLGYQREEIERVFGCKVYDWYGSGERVAAIAQCEYGTYHEIPHYGVVEYLPGLDNKYEIIGTTLHNRVMPLLRYKVGDLVELGEGSTCPCGRQFREIKSIVGRDEDMLEFKDGRKVRVIVTRVLQGVHNVREAQIIQYALDSFLIKVVPEDPTKSVAAHMIVDHLVKYTGGEKDNYQYQIVDYIERGKNGKFKFVDNQMNRRVPALRLGGRPTSMSGTGPLKPPVSLRGWQYFVRDYAKYKLRTGKKFTRFLRECEAAEHYSAQEIDAYRREHLQTVIREAYANVPFYRETMKKLHLTPDDFTDLTDLQKLPVIEKKTVQEHFEGFRNASYSGLRFRGHTGGTTGAPGVFLRDPDSINFENAALWRQYMWTGKPLKSRRAVIRGTAVVAVNRTRPPFWQYNHAENDLILSSYHMSDENLRSYIEEIRRFHPFDLYAYPSTAYILANYCKRKGVDLQFQCVFTSSEMVLDYQRDEIEKVFGCRVFDWYGSGERVAAIGQCEYGTYHEIPHYGIIEYLPVEDGKYEIVGTSLHNRVMPLIRYKVGDIVGIDDAHVCRCGRKFRTIRSIIGREEDLLFFEDGRRSIVMETKIFDGMQNIREAQFLQFALDTIIIKVVPEDPRHSVPVDTIVDRMVRFVGGTPSNFSVQVVDHIERTRNGKYKFVENHLARIG
jgi:phenylacetate-CoA ligase